MARHLIRCVTMVLAMTVIASVPYSKAAGEETHNHHHGHDIGGLEFGASTGYVEREEGDGAIGMHLHVMKRLGDEGLSKGIAIGPATEVILGDHEHYTVMLSLSIYPWRGLALAVAPGIEWTAHESEWESRYATHLEMGYLFEVGRFDLGPTIGYSASDEDHYSLGIHAGIHL